MKGKLFPDETYNKKTIDIAINVYHQLKREKSLLSKWTQLSIVNDQESTKRNEIEELKMEMEKMKQAYAQLKRESDEKEKQKTFMEHKFNDQQQQMMKEKEELRMQLRKANEQKKKSNQLGFVTWSSKLTQWATLPRHVPLMGTTSGAPHQPPRRRRVATGISGLCLHPLVPMAVGHDDLSPTPCLQHRVESRLQAVDYLTRGAMEAMPALP